MWIRYAADRDVRACPVAPTRGKGGSNRGSFGYCSSLLFIISILPDCQALDKPLCETKCKIYSDRILRDSADQEGSLFPFTSPPLSLSLSELALDSCNILSITLAAVAEIASWHCGNMSAVRPLVGASLLLHMLHVPDCSSVHLSPCSALLSSSLCDCDLQMHINFNVITFTVRRSGPAWPSDETTIPPPTPPPTAVAASFSSCCCCCCPVWRLRLRLRLRLHSGDFATFHSI